jgi:hypothetical protein
MRPPRSWLAALLAAGALGVHELRVRLVEGGAEAGSGAGHAYLGVLTALVGVALALALARYLQLWIGRRSGGCVGRRPVALWLLASVLVLAGYVSQELIAGWLSAGHPAGLAAILAHGGGIALPLAAAFGGIAVLLSGGAEALLERRCRDGASRPLRASNAATRRPGARFHGSGRVVARHLAGRSPPALLSR